MEWIILDGYRMEFFTTLSSSSFQSVLGPAPDFIPSTLYYALLLAATANNNQPYIIRPTMTSSASASIKAYYLDYSTYFGVLILNKDTNSSASGQVEVKMTDPSGLNCFYFSADNLSSTKATIGGYSFVGGNSTPQGLFSSLKVLQNPITKTYSVPLNYSQVAFCKTLADNTLYFNFPRMSSSTAWENWLGFTLFFLFHMIFF